MNSPPSSGAPGRVAIELTVNGEAVRAEVEPRTHLADFLREELLLTGTHLGCEQGVCGACTVMIDGEPMRSCLAFAAACDGSEVRTIEGFENDPLMARLREAFSSRHALQCGFCTPGMLATAYDIARRLPDADAERIRRELSGNLCRCTGYQGLVLAIADVLKDGPHDAAIAPKPREARRRLGMEETARRAAVASVPRAEALEVPDAIEGGQTLSRKVAIAAAADAVWPILRDVERLAACVPGAALDGAPEDGRVAGSISVALGPMRARFGGAGDLRYDEAARSGTAIGRGRDRISRTQLDGALDFALAALDENRSELRLEMRYRLSGPLAQFGRPEVVGALADRLLAQTAEAIAARADGREAAAKPADGFGLIWTALAALMRSLTGRR